MTSILKPRSFRPENRKCPCFFSGKACGDILISRKNNSCRDVSTLSSVFHLRPSPYPLLFLVLALFRSRSISHGFRNQIGISVCRRAFFSLPWLERRLQMAFWFYFIPNRKGKKNLTETKRERGRGRKLENGLGQCRPLAHSRDLIKDYLEANVARGRISLILIDIIGSCQTFS